MFTAIGSRLGQITLAANAILISIQMFISYGLDGFAQAAEVLVGNNYKNTKKIIDSSLTTPSNLDLYQFAYSNKKNHDVFISEASSHGLKQKRLDFLKVKAGIFTNLSHDHLDYHKNMKDYLHSKLLLFKDILTRMQLQDMVVLI